jgi:uncharacterized protein (TIGR03083 family)
MEPHASLPGVSGFDARARERPFGRIYDDARHRIAHLARGLSETQLAATVPGTPDWTGRQVVAHLAGAASDAVHGRTEGMPGPGWTAPQVATREGRTLDQLLAEWSEVAPGVVEALAQRRLPLPIVHDVLTHEGDLREAFGLGPLPAEVVDAALPTVAKPVVQRASRHGALLVRAGEREWRGGDGDPAATLTVEPYELYRGLISRRSRAQIRAWDWTGDPEPFADALPVFGPRDDDQPVP